MPDGHFLATAEAMSPGHPDKVADQIAEAIVDAFLEQDSDSIVSVQVVTKTGMIIAFGSVISNGTIDFNRVIRGTVKNIGYDAAEKGLDYKNMEVLNRIDILSRSGTDSFIPEDGGIFSGYATNETPQMVPLNHQLATKLCEMLSTKQVRREFGTFAGALRPDGKAQVTIEYETKQDGSLQPVRVHAIVMSVQHGPDITTDRLRSEVIAHVIKPAIPANLLDDKTQLLVNPAGRFVIGGPHGDAGASGRQIVADAGGPWTAHGGSAATGKTGAKVERCGAYAARWAAKSLVEAGFASRCAVQLAYTSGKTEPSLCVESFGSAWSGMSDQELVDVLQQHFDFKPGTLVQQLQLRKPQFFRYATFGHCGRTEPVPLWEKSKNLTGAAVQTALQAGVWQ